MADLSKLVSVIQIEGVRLCEGSCRSFVRPSDSEEDLKVKVAYSTAVTRQDNSLLVKADFNLKGHTDTDEERLLVEMRCVFELSYQLSSDKDFSTEELDEFGRVNAVFNAWPYWREYVQTSLARMSMPIVTVPVFRVLPRPAAKSQGSRRPKELN